MYTLAKANASHIRALKHIWQICFDDTKEYIEFFFEKCFPMTKCIVLLCDNLPVGAMYLMDIHTTEYDTFKKGFYIYAVGILPEHRGKGLFKLMHDALSQYLLSNNLFAALCPANEKLCEYYANLGYIENAYLSEKTIIPQNGHSTGYSVQVLTTDLFIEMRNSYLSSNAILWADNFLDYIISENQFCDGYNLLLDDSCGKKHFVVANKSDDCLYIVESDIPYEKLQQFTDFLCSYTHTKEARWKLPLGYNPQKCILQAMTYNLRKNNYYFNHILN